MHEEGHLIGNHTYNHVRITKVSKKEAKEEIERTGNKIYETIGVYPIYLRPPFGEVREDLELPVELFYVSWNIDTLDWEDKKYGFHSPDRKKADQRRFYHSYA